MRPRIYTYKINFEEVPYYYYGSKKEKYYNQEYWGSPYTHKWCWQFYTPKKQILEFFEYSDEGWLKAQETEKQLIKPFYRNDKWCLNENCGGKISLKVSSKNGSRTKENGTGIFSLTKEERSQNSKKSGKISGKKCYETKTGVFSLTPEERSKLSKQVASQKWMCTITGYTSNAPGLSTYQKARGIDTSRRRRIA